MVRANVGLNDVECGVHLLAAVDIGEPVREQPVAVREQPGASMAQKAFEVLSTGCGSSIVGAHTRNCESDGLADTTIADPMGRKGRPMKSRWPNIPMSFTHWLYARPHFASVGTVDPAVGRRDKGPVAGAPAQVFDVTHR